MSAAAAPQKALPDAQLLGEKIAEAMARLHVPGVAVGLLLEGEEYTAGFGVTSVDHPLPVDGHTLFQIGSTTKTVTGTAVMRLVEQGKLDLDAPLRAYLPELRLADEDVAARVTLRHVLTHTGGWAGDHFADAGVGDDARARVGAGMAELPQLTPLGEVWSYNNAGFYLAGRAVEVATGMSYEAAAKELVLDPLGMTMSFFFPAQVMTHRFAVGHIVKDGRPQVARPWPIARAANAAGGLASTARDQLEYARFHMGDGTAPDGTRLLGADLMQRMQTPAVATDGLGTYVGITWMLRDVGGERLVRHGGATHGQLSAFIMVPARRFAITVLTNANRGGELHGEITKWALERYLGLAEPEPEFRDLPPEALREYAGYYTGALSTSDVRLELREGGLVMHSILKGGFPYRDVAPPPAPPPVRVAICGDDTFVALDPPLKDARGEFLRRPDGAIQWLRFGGRIRARHPADAPAPG